ncbi:MAG: fumarylacetoacetate hydrolase family protein [Prevotella sp.]|nr:fumarylacetoacetate hydrolase family protein [Prevotella sp.]
MKIFAIGMNYVQHNKELDATLYKPEAPVVFTKADSALLKPGKPFFVPDHLGRIDYEGELVVRICRLGKSIPRRFAHRYYDAVTIGIDFTARDMQREARQKGLPWTICKGFDGSAAIGEWLELEGRGLKAEGGEQLCFRIDLNGKTVQQATTADMLYGVDELIEYLSQFFTLKTGDLIFTGTPAGVGPVAVGDLIEGFIGNSKVLSVRCK